MKNNRKNNSRGYSLNTSWETFQKRGFYIVIFSVIAIITFCLYKLVQNFSLLKWLIPTSEDTPTRQLLKTLLIGALGSGVWEIILKPSSRLISNGIINSNKVISDGIHQDIAKYSYEIDKYTVVVSSCVLITSSLLWINYYRKAYPSYMTSMNAASFILTAVVFVSAAATITKYAFLVYKTQAISDYKWLLRRCSPELTDQMMKEYDYRFSKIQCKEDYEKICQELYDYMEEVMKEEMAKSNDRKVKEEVC